MSCTNGPRSSEPCMSKCEQKDRRHKALEILARMIVRAYLGEIARGEAGPTAYRETETKMNRTNKRRQRDRKASPPRRNKVVNRVRER